MTTYLDPTEIGNALLRVALIARQMGHVHAADTARDYLSSPGARAGLSPEMLFVIDVLTKPVEESVSEAELKDFIRQREWTAPA